MLKFLRQYLNESVFEYQNSYRKDQLTEGIIIYLWQF